MILANYRYPLETDCIELHRLRAIIGVAINSWCRASDSQYFGWFADVGPGSSLHWMLTQPDSMEITTRCPKMSTPVMSNETCMDIEAFRSCTIGSLINQAESWSQSESILCWWELHPVWSMGPVTLWELAGERPHHWNTVAPNLIQTVRRNVDLLHTFIRVLHVHFISEWVVFFKIGIPCYWWRDNIITAFLFGGRCSGCREYSGSHRPTHQS